MASTEAESLRLRRSIISIPDWQRPVGTPPRWNRAFGSWRLTLESAASLPASVFELVHGEPMKGMSFRADADQDLWAKHERSFLLAIPGKAPDTKVFAPPFGRLPRGRPLAPRFGSPEERPAVAGQEEASEERGVALTQHRQSVDGNGRDETAYADRCELGGPTGCSRTGQPLWEHEVQRNYAEAETLLSQQIRASRKAPAPVRTMRLSENYGEVMSAENPPGRSSIWKPSAVYCSAGAFTVENTQRSTVLTDTGRGHSRRGCCHTSTHSKRIGSRPAAISSCKPLADSCLTGSEVGSRRTSRAG